MSTPDRPLRAGYTLLEILVVIVVMGIAGAMVIPVVGSADVLRSQSAVRSVVSDIMFAQSDAIAAQEPRAVVFSVDDNGYSLVAVPGAVIDPATNVLYDPFSLGKDYVVDLDDGDYGKAKISTVNFDADNSDVLLFDEFGAPIRSPGAADPTTGGYVYIEDETSWYYITVEGMTGQVWTKRVPK